MFVKIDKTYWPVVAIRFEKQPENDEEFDQFLQDIKNLYNTKEPVWLIFETVGIGLKPIYISKMVKFMIEINQLTREFMQKCAIVITREKIQTLVNLIIRLARPPGEIKCFSDFEQGWSWLVSR